MFPSKPTRKMGSLERGGLNGRGKGYLKNGATGQRVSLNRPKNTRCPQERQASVGSLFFRRPLTFNGSRSLVCIDMGCMSTTFEGFSLKIIAKEPNTYCMAWVPMENY